MKKQDARIVADYFAIVARLYKAAATRPGTPDGETWQDAVNQQQKYLQMVNG